jgi:hypothetical protein
MQSSSRCEIRSENIYCTSESLWSALGAAILDLERVEAHEDDITLQILPWMTGEN